MWSQRPSFRFEIDNFSEKEVAITSAPFVSGGCEWFLSVYPKGDSRCDDHMSLYLYALTKYLQTGWTRRARYYFVVLNQSDKELYRSSIGNGLFCAKARGFGFRKTLPLSKFEEEGFLENDRLIIEVYINVTEADDREGEDVSQKEETGEISGFQAFTSHVKSVKKTFTEHVAKKDYMNVLSNACTKVSELAEESFKMDWLKSKLDEVSLKMKKADDVDGSQIQQLEQRIKNLEVMGSDLKMDCCTLKSKLEEVSNNEVSSLIHRLHLEELIKNLEPMGLNDADRSHVQQLEERIKNLEVMETKMKAKIEEVSLERKKSDDANVLRCQKIEECLESYQKMVWDIKLELEAEDSESSDEVEFHHIF